MLNSPVLKKLSLCFLLAGKAFAADSYVNFESHQFRPVEVSPSGERLFVTNTPDNRIEIFDLSDSGIRHTGSVLVGLEPVAVAARSDKEIWVVNHLSDSVSIVDVSGAEARVTRTLLVGDEPRDIVFAGKNRSRAFITAAHRGQNSPYQDETNPGELTTPGIGRADVWVFDAKNPGKAFGGEPEAVLALFGDSPGPLAVNADGSRVYAGVFKSGNQTTIVGRVLVCDGGGEAGPCEVMKDGPVAPGGLPAPNENIEGIPMPKAGLIVRWDGEGWKDELDRDWSDVIRLDLPDYDVFEIDALARKPVELRSFPSVGTILYGMQVNPVTGDLYVANTEARNEVRFEGTREPGSDISTVQGHLHEARLSILSTRESASVTPVHLNPHIDYQEFPVAKSVRERSLSMPVAVAFASKGDTAFVVAKGSDKVAVLPVDALQAGQFTPDTKQHIEVPGGPSGIALDEARDRLYVLSRFDNTVSVVDAAAGKVVQTVTLHNPEPDEITAGRPFFYNAFLTSGNGESSCASCHVAGDKDELSWDLGDPNGLMLPNPGKVIGPLKGDPQFHPMKGPMLTQTMRGLANHGPLHWRGDRTAGNDPGGDPLDTAGAMHKFNGAFVSLMGRDSKLSKAEMQQLTDFSMNIIPPPNPVRALDDSLTTSQARGKLVFEKARTVPGGATCGTCHVVNRSRGWYGTRGDITHIIGGRLTKIPHHRNTYERVGMFGRAPSKTLRRDGEHMGPQIRGYGFTHDGGADTTIRFMSYPAFRFRNGDEDRRAIEQYLFAFEANLKPVVGQQVTLTSRRDRAAIARAQLLVARARAGDAQLVAHVSTSVGQRGYLLMADGLFKPDSTGAGSIGFDELIEQVSGKATLTFMAVPVGGGVRIALDRDEDGVPDNDDFQ